MRFRIIQLTIFSFLDSDLSHYREKPMKFINKVIVITGGTSGIGYQMAKILQKDNQVIIVARDKNKLDDLTRKFPAIVTFKADLSNLKETETVADAIKNAYEFIDVLINNAAVQNTPTFLDDDFRYETIAQEITLNLTSICSLTYLMLPVLLKEAKSIIMNINTGLALAPKTSSAIYCGSKGGLAVFSQSLRYQLKDTNISVQQAFLDIVDTAMTAGRGKNKMSAENAARNIINGMQREILDHDLGKVKLLRSLLRLAPSIAKKIMMKM